jgi:hypothetical protein
LVFFLLAGFIRWGGIRRAAFERHSYEKQNRSQVLCTVERRRSKRPLVGHGILRLRSARLTAGASLRITARRKVQT